MKYIDRYTWFWAVLAALFFLPFLGGVHLFDWDEINFAELAREMLVTGEWLQLQINFERFTEKPPFFFWLQGLSMLVFGVGEYAARFPNALLGVVVIPFLYTAGKYLHNRRFGYLWALSWLGSILPFLYFKSGIIDPWFNFFIFGGIFCLFLYIRSQREGDHIGKQSTPFTCLLLAALSVGLAVLTKGPVAYLLVFLTFLSHRLFFRSKSQLPIGRFMLFSVLVLLVFSLWLLADIALHGPDFLIEFTVRQWELLVNNDAGHGGFPGYHFIVLFFGCFPASIVALRALGRFRDIPTPLADFQRYMILLLAVVLLLFTLVNTKIIHYSSMAYYPISFLSALSLYHWLEKKERASFWTGILIGLVGTVIIAISVALPYLGMHPEHLKVLLAKDPFALANLEAAVHWSWIDFTPGVIFGLVLLTFVFLYRKHRFKAWQSLFFGTALWVFSALIFFVAKVEAYSQRAAVEFFEKHHDESVYVCTYGYKSYVPWFYARIDADQDPKAQSLEWLYHGAVDRDVLISTKVQRVDKLKKEIPDAEFLYEKNGFHFFRRKATEQL